MIKKAQAKFIAITTSILLCVFIVIFGASYFILRNANDRTIQQILEDTENNFYQLKDDFVQPHALVAIITPLQNDTPLYKCWYDNNTFSENQILNIVNLATNSAYNFGSINTVYYKITTNGNDYLLVASDMQDTIAIFQSNCLNAFFTLLIIYSILSLVVFRLSFSVFRPIKEAFLKQKQFISNASHELKTPLTIISANTDVLMQTTKNQWVDNIKSQTERLNDLVADMLTLAKIDEDKPKLNFAEFNLSEEILGVTLPFDAVAYEKNKTLVLNIDPDIYYKGDYQSVKKITNILLDNAVKHACDNGQIVVTLKKENGKISLAVFNSGSSIPSQDSNKIFERFYRGEYSRTRESGGGSGLGLSIAKTIADNNKWKISAHSRQNESMTITIIF